MPFSVTTRDIFVNCDISLAGAQKACTFPRGMATARPSDLHGHTHQSYGERDHVVGVLRLQPAPEKRYTQNCDMSRRRAPCAPEQVALN